MIHIPIFHSMSFTVVLAPPFIWLGQLPFIYSHGNCHCRGSAIAPEFPIWNGGQHNHLTSVYGVRYAEILTRPLTLFLPCQPNRCPSILQAVRNRPFPTTSRLTAGAPGRSIPRRPSKATKRPYQTKTQPWQRGDQRISTLRIRTHAC